MGNVVNRNWECKHCGNSNSSFAKCQKCGKNRSFDVSDYQDTDSIFIQSKQSKKDKLGMSKHKGTSSLAEVIYGIWQDKLHCATALEMFNHVVDNNFDMFTPFSDSVPLNRNLIKTPSFRCKCGCNLFYETRDLADNHLILHCTNCEYPNWF